MNHLQIPRNCRPLRKLGLGKKLRSISAVVAMLLAPLSVLAAETAWVGGVGGLWNEPSNWSNHVLPSASIDARIKNGRALLFGGSVGSSQLLILDNDFGPVGRSVVEVSDAGGGPGTLISTAAYIGLSNQGPNAEGRVIGAGSTWTIEHDLIAGYSGQGDLLVQNGARVSSGRGFLGDGAGGVAIASIDGEGAVWNSGSELRIGNFGRGYMYATQGGDVINTRAFIGYQLIGVGHVTIWNPGSTWESGEITVGYQSVYENTFDIIEGGAVTSDRGVIGDLQAAVGKVKVEDNGSAWELDSDLRVGNAGQGSLEILGGGRVNNSVGYIGAFASGLGTATVSGLGSAWTSSGDLYVGHQSTQANALNIQNRGVVASNRGFIGDFPNAVGTVTVDGAESIWNGGSEIRIGNFGSGTLRVQNGGAVAGGNGRIGMQAGSQGVASVSGAGSNLTLSGDLYVGGDGQGSLSASNLGIVSATGGVAVMPNGQLSGDGTIVASEVVNSGHVRPGSGPPSTLTINGNYKQTVLGTVHIELEAADSYDRLAINGSATLAGTLELTLSTGFPFYLPQIGDTFNIFDWVGSPVGKFDSLALPPLPGSRRWNTSRLYSRGELFVVPASSLTSDFEGDGDIDGADLAKWQIGFGASGGATRMQGDADGDLDVDGADFLTWQQQLDMPTVVPSARGVPEPASYLLAALAIGLFVRRNRI